MKLQHYRPTKAPSGAFFVSDGGRGPQLPIVGHGGGKSGGGGRSPKESPDSLHGTAYARIIDLISEGEVYGPAHGATWGLRDVYLDGTPVANADGSLNFPDIEIDFRTGTQTQEPLPGFPASENTVAVNTELKSGAPWVQAFNNLQLSAVRVNLGFSGLSQANESKGIGGYRVEYRIELSTDGGAYQTVLTGAADGKTTQHYPRSHRVDLPTARQGWSIRVVRLTPNANSNTIADRTLIDSYAEVIDAKLRYPMSAVVGIKVDASRFQSIPTRAYDWKGRIIRVPSNYDPETRIYYGTWDGTFKLAWTDNPAWIFFDLVSNERYGLGQRIPAGWLDKWGLYQIGRYCDELVPDGFGGQEPRFTCNCYLQSASEAYRVIQDLATVFRGMAYWSSGYVVAVADMPGDPVYTFTGANVIDRRFNYVGSALDTRHTVALVSWNDLSDMGRQKVEYVEDREALARYGLKKVEVSAFGCTSRGQANRVGKWLLLTSRMETRSVTFSVGLDSCRVRPGSIIRVADQNLAGRRIGGRIREATDTVVTVDAALGVRPGDRLTVNLPSGVSETRTISSATGQGLTADMTTFTVDSTELTADMVGLPGTVLVLTVTAPYSEVPEPECVWALESETLSTQLFRVVRVKRVGGLQADISAIQHEPGKFNNVDFGTRLDPPPISVIPPGVQPPPTDVTITSYPVISQGYASHTAVFSWTRAPSAVAYEVQWRRDNSEWVNLPRTGSTSIEVPGIYAGAFMCRVRALNALDVSSIWASSTLTQLDGILAPPPMVTSLIPTPLVFAIRLKWGLPTGPSIIERTEIWYSTLPTFESAQKLGDFAFPQDSTTLMGLSAGARLYFWAILRDRNGVAGARYPAGNGVLGESSWDAGEILGYLTGKITKTQLAQDILTPIEEIPVLETRIAEEETIRQSQNEAMAQTISTVSSKVNENTSLIQEEALTRANETGSLGRLVTSVQATAENAEGKADQAFAGVQETSQAIAKTNGDLAAMWSVKTQTTSGGRTYIAGIGVGVENTGGVVESQVLVMADRFAILHPNGVSTTSGFVYQNGQAFINQALFGEAWIKNGHIESLDAGKITTGYMNADRIDANSFTAKVASIETAYVNTANIKVAQIDTLRIANGAVVAGASGAWTTEFGSSGSQQTPIGSVPLYLPHGGTLLAFIQARVSGGAWGSFGYKARLIASINGNPIILDASPADGQSGHTNVDIVTGFSYVYGPVGPGAYTLSIDVFRPFDGRATYSVSAALLGFQR